MDERKVDRGNNYIVRIPELCEMRKVEAPREWVLLLLLMMMHMEDPIRLKNGGG